MELISDSVATMIIQETKPYSSTAGIFNDPTEGKIGRRFLDIPCFGAPKLGIKLDGSVRWQNAQKIIPSIHPTSGKLMSYIRRSTPPTPEDVTLNPVSRSTKGRRLITEGIILGNPKEEKAPVTLPSMAPNSISPTDSMIPIDITTMTLTTAVITDGLDNKKRIMPSRSPATTYMPSQVTVGH